MNQDNVLRLLIVNDDANEAEALISAIKSSGFGVRAAKLDDSSELAEVLETHNPDMVLHAVDHPSIVLEETANSIQETGNYIPIIALGSDDSKRIQYMQLGAEDLIDKGNREHLTLVVKRATQARRQWVRTKEYETALSESEKRCRILLDSSKDPICYVHEGMHVYANETYLETFGFSDFEEVEGMPLMDMVSPEDQASMKELLRKLNKTGTPPEPLPLNLIKNDETPIKGVLHFSRASIDGEPCVQIVIRKPVDTGELEQQIADLSQRDPVTGLLNRKFFLAQLEATISEAIQQQIKKSIVLLQMTNIQDIRERVGVSAFDTAIAEFAKQLETHSSSQDTVARFSDDVFCLLADESELQQLEDRLKNLWQSLSEHLIEVEDYSITVELSMGAARIDQNAPETNELVQRCETALAQAKQKSAPHIAVYTPKQGEMTQRELDTYWEEELESALKEGRIKLLFQPIVSLHGEPGERYELFLRLVDQQGELVSASKFLPSAERSGIAGKLDRYLIQNAVDRIIDAKSSGRNTTLFLKLSSAALQDPGLAEWLADLIQEKQLPPWTLVFELKEVALVNFLKQAISLADHLKDLKCGLAVDDFGIGAKPFQLLKAVSVEYLKLEKGLMENIASDKDKQEALKTITSTAHTAKKLVVAPFVENAASLSVLWETGANYIQGEFLQEPSDNMDYDFSAFA